MIPVSNEQASVGLGKPYRGFFSCFFKNESPVSNLLNIGEKKAVISAKYLNFHFEQKIIHLGLASRSRQRVRAMDGMFYLIFRRILNCA
ncbi:hypothetical protein X474_19630 [Dethiosulfatarculus sandiegensis]|uniref:Uncharacterized protein n=1 Tax=Dethiosulfatarculus sandiegensis TaxID=1429043 RepID=A0A0D2GBI9_9BACT|nr:hypothetical protein X474_19630 [Dethiosulfatarculus sandiegensis]